MTNGNDADPDDLRRRQPLLGDERRVHPPPRPEVRRTAACALRRRRRQAALHVRRAAAPDHPGPGRRAPAAAAGRALRLLRGQERQGDASATSWRARSPPEHPEWFDRDAAPAVHGRAGRRGGVVVPVAGRVHGRPDAARHRGVDPHPRARSTGGSTTTGASPTRTGSSRCRSSRSPTSTRRSRSCDWCLDRGARVVSIRNGPAFTPEGTKSPADPMFDPFWARVAEAGVVVAPHAGFEDGYVAVTPRIAEEWGRSPAATGDAVDAVRRRCISMLMKHRLVHDFAGILVADRLFERHPGVRVAYIENGGTWVGDLLHGLQVLHGQNPGMFAKNPVDQFHEHCWVAPFVEDSVPELAKHIPVERILFGSDWPHAEGIGPPAGLLRERRGVLDRGPAQDHGGERASSRSRSGAERRGAKVLLAEKCVADFRPVDYIPVVEKFQCNLLPERDHEQSGRYAHRPSAIRAATTAEDAEVGGDAAAAPRRRGRAVHRPRLQRGVDARHRGRRGAHQGRGVRALPLEGPAPRRGDPLEDRRARPRAGLQRGDGRPASAGSS